MYVCVCNGVTDRDIRRAAADGCRDLSELSMRTGAGLTCGTCSALATEILDQAKRELVFPLPLLVAA